MHSTDPGSSPAGSGEMAMVPGSVGRASRDWDEQHVDLRAAAQQIAQAPTAGFTDPVARAAADFMRAWSQHTGVAAELSELQADALRVVMSAWIRTDEQAGARAFALLPFLDERR